MEPGSWHDKAFYNRLFFPCGFPEHKRQPCPGVRTKALSKANDDPLTIATPAPREGKSKQAGRWRHSHESGGSTLSVRSGVPARLCIQGSHNLVLTTEQNLTALVYGLGTVRNGKCNIHDLPSPARQVLPSLCYRGVEQAAKSSSHLPKVTGARGLGPELPGIQQLGN